MFSRGVETTRRLAAAARLMFVSVASVTSIIARIMRGFFKGGLEVALYYAYFDTPDTSVPRLQLFHDTNVAQLENSSCINDMLRRQCPLSNGYIKMGINHRRPPHVSICRRIAEAQCRVITETSKPLYFVICQASRNLRAGSL